MTARRKKAAEGGANGPKLHGRRGTDHRRGGATLITGGAGFIGTNLAARLASQGARVIVYDNLSRRGVEANAAFLSREFGDRVDVRIEDVRDRSALRACLSDAASVFHFAAQVAVTTSLLDPDEDRLINVGGTMAVLEEIRALGRPCPLVFTSTNKVYGNLGDVDLVVEGGRYRPADGGMAWSGVGEDRPLQFCSPYGCSKGAADQYVLDYAHSYGLLSCVFRMSCIYGPHQCGNEDQGWLAHFLKAAAAGETINIYGDGRQVRDALYVEDLVSAFLLARERISEVRGRAFNIGGGPRFTVSLLELLDLIEELEGRRPATSFSGWRVGDQRWYVSDIRRFMGATGWAPRVDVREGVSRLHEWLGSEPAPMARAREARVMSR